MTAILAHCGGGGADTPLPAPTGVKIAFDFPTAFVPYVDRFEARDQGDPSYVSIGLPSAQEDQLGTTVFTTAPIFHGPATVVLRACGLNQCFSDSPPLTL